MGAIALLLVLLGGAYWASRLAKKPSPVQAGPRADFVLSGFPLSSTPSPEGAVMRCRPDGSAAILLLTNSAREAHAEKSPPEKVEEWVADARKRGRGQFDFSSPWTQCVATT